MGVCNTLQTNCNSINTIQLNKTKKTAKKGCHKKRQSTVKTIFFESKILINMLGAVARNSESKILTI